MNYRKIDMDTFPRRKHFEYFCSLQYPYAGMTNNVDVTELIQFCKKHHYSFFLTFLWIVAQAANDTRVSSRVSAIMESLRATTVPPIMWN